MSGEDVQRLIVGVVLALCIIGVFYSFSPGGGDAD